jgi:hypothetical protein
VVRFLNTVLLFPFPWAITANWHSIDWARTHWKTF